VNLHAQCIWTMELLNLWVVQPLLEKWTSCCLFVSWIQRKIKPIRCNFVDARAWAWRSVVIVSSLPDIKLLSVCWPEEVTREEGHPKDVGMEVEELHHSWAHKSFSEVRVFGLTMHQHWLVYIIDDVHRSSGSICTEACCSSHHC